MRRAAVLMLVGLAGCMKPAGTGTAPTAAQPQPTATTASTAAATPEAPRGPAIPVYYTTLLDEYQVNQLAADAKYRGKLVRVGITVEEVGRRGEKAFLGTADVAAKVPPNLVCYLADPADPKVLAIKPGATCTIDGVVAGRVDDGVYRGIRGKDFHVALTGCHVLETGPTMESLKLAPPFPRR